MIYKTEFGFCKIYKDLTCEWYPNIEMHFWTYFPHLILTTSRIDILQKLSNSRPKSLSNVQIKLFCPVQIICVTWVCDQGTHQLTSWSWWNIHGIAPANSIWKIQALLLTKSKRVFCFSSSGFLLFLDLSNYSLYYILCLYYFLKFWKIPLRIEKILLRVY